MLTIRREPFPFDAVRDLLGVVRALYVARRQSNSGPVPLARIVRIGSALAQALELATKHGVGTVGHAAAWARAERAAVEVGDLVELTDGALELVEAARRRAFK